MSQIFSYINPIRFHKYGEEIDYVNNLPSFDYMKKRVQYSRNVYPADYYHVHQLGEEMSIQVSLDKTKVINADAYSNGLYYATSIVAADSLATNINITINNPGVYYYILILEIDNINVTFVSDEFKFVEWAEKKDLIKITCSDTNNDNGGRFYNSAGDAIWNPSVYYHGRIDKEPTQYNRSVFTSQTNNQQVIRSTPKLVDKITISCIHETDYDNLSYQLTCNTIYVNDVQYAVESVGKFDKIASESDIGNVEIIISRNSNNNYQQFL